MVTDFYEEDKASSIKFCTAVHRRKMRGISHFCELCSPGSPKYWPARRHLHDVHNDYSLAAEYIIARRVDVGSACVDKRPSPKDVLVLFLKYSVVWSKIASFTYTICIRRIRWGEPTGNHINLRYRKITIPKLQRSTDCLMFG